MIHGLASFGSSILKSSLTESGGFTRSICVASGLKASIGATARPHQHTARVRRGRELLACHTGRETS